MLNKVSLSHTCPCGVELDEDFLHPHLFNSLIHDSSHILLKAVQVEQQQVGQSGILLTENDISTWAALWDALHNLIILVTYDRWAQAVIAGFSLTRDYI